MKKVITIFRITTLLYGLTFSIYAFSQFSQLNEFPHLKEANDYLKIYSDPIEILEIMEQELIAYPNSVEILLKSARLKQLYGFEEEAQIDIEKAIEINPLALDLYGFYGPENIINIMAYVPENSTIEIGLERRLEPYSEMLKDTLKAQQLNIEKMLAIENCIKVIQKGNLQTALEDVNQLVKQFPNCAMGHDLKGLILELQNNLVAAANSLSKAVVLEPGYSLAWYNFSRVERKLGKTDVAKKYLDRAIKLNSNLSKAYFDKALLLKAMGETEAAINNYDKVIDNADNYPEAYLNRGLTLKMLGNLDGALKDLDKAIEFFPSNAQLYKNRANIKFIQSNHLGAIKDYDKAIEIDAFLSEAYMNRGLANFILGNINDACSDFDRSASLGFERADVKLNILCSD